MYYGYIHTICCHYIRFICQYTKNKYTDLWCIVPVLFYYADLHRCILLAYIWQVYTCTPFFFYSTEKYRTFYWVILYIRLPLILHGCTQRLFLTDLVRISMRKMNGIIHHMLYYEGIGSIQGYMEVSQGATCMSPNLYLM